MSDMGKALLGEQVGLKAVIAFAGSAATFLFGEWSQVLYALGYLIILDYVTGFLASAVERKLSSKVGLKSIPRKAGIAVIVSVLHWVDLTLGTGPFFRDAGIYFYMANEILSITENVGRMGLPIPPVVEKAVQVFQEKEGEK